MSNPVIEIPYRDWLEEYMRDEPDVSTEEKLIEALKCATSAKVARWAIVARERGDAPQNLLKPNKLLLYAGGQADIASKYAAQKRRVQLENGREINVRAYVGPVPKEEEEQADFETTVEAGVVQDDNLFLVEALSVQGCERALYYLRKVVPGHVWGRLEIVAINRGDVQGVAQELIGEIEKMVERLDSH